jgi:hypothetical protein
MADSHSVRGPSAAGKTYEERRKAMMGIVGLWKDRGDIGDPRDYIRNLRRSTRLERLRD